MIDTKDNPFGQVVSISGMNMIVEINKDLLQRNLEQHIRVQQSIIKLLSEQWEIFFNR